MNRPPAHFPPPFPGQARDPSLGPSGARSRPLYLSCYLGTQLGTAVGTGAYCPSGLVLPADYSSAAAGGGNSTAVALGPGSPCYTQAGNLSLGLRLLSLVFWFRV